MAAQLVVGIADCAVSDDPETTLVTYALGSCIGVAVWDPLTKVSGMLHFMLPDSAMDSVRGRENPCLYGDTGIAELVARCLRKGAQKSRLIVRVAGGAQILGDAEFFSIGKRNHLSMRKALWKAGLLVQSEMTGGAVSRTMRLEAATGKCSIHEQGKVVDMPLPRAQGVK